MDVEALKEFITTLLGLLGVSFSSIEVSKGHRTVVSVTTNEEEALLGVNGETLRALTMIARRMVEVREHLCRSERPEQGESSNFIIDINGKQEALLEGVRSSALMLAQRARLFKQDVALEPMNPYERLVVHELFAHDKEIKTESAGEGKTRHIVLKYVATRG